jgi:hypothetical protein
MQKLYFEPTDLTPEINFSPDENKFIIRGISSPEDVRALYYPVIEWIKIFIDDIIEGTVRVFNKNSPVRMHIDLSYFNSSSAKFLFDIFTELKRLKVSEVPVVVEWFYEDEDLDMREAGSDIAELVEMEFTFITKPKMNQ